MHFRLIQRGVFRAGAKPSEGLDALVQMDYMGAAEFEWGALPEALRRICGNLSNLVPSHTGLVAKGGSMGQEGLWLISTKEAAPEIAAFLTEDAVTPHPRLKERTRLNRVLSREVIFGQSGYSDFWWDIKNDWMAFLNKGNAPRILTALEAVKAKKGW